MKADHETANYSQARKSSESTIASKSCSTYADLSFKQRNTFLVTIKQSVHDEICNLTISFINELNIFDMKKK